MKRLLTILFLLCAAPVFAQFSLAPLTNDLVINQYGDSYEIGPFGNRSDCYIDSAIINLNPNVTVRPRTESRSGGNNQEELVRIAEYGAGNYFYTHGKTNVLDVLRVSSNGSFSSNQIFGFVGQELQAPYSMVDQTTNLVHDWTQATNLYDKYVVGDFPQANLDFTYEARSLGGSNAAVGMGYRYIDTWDTTLTNIIAVLTAGGTNLYHTGGHPDSVLQFIWGMIQMRGMSLPTNVFTCVLDWNSSTPTQTNFCSVSGLSRSGNSMTFTFKADRQGPGFDIAINGQTNDVSPGFALYPALGNQFMEILRVLNLPAGNYQLTMHGTNWIQLSSDQLAAGFNVWSNYAAANEFFTQAAATLAQQRIERNVDPNTASDTYDTHENFLNDNYQSWARQRWPTNTEGVDFYGALMQDREQELVTQDGVIHASAQQVTHDIGISLIAPRLIFAPFHR
jgi:hypothetical protein